MAGPALDNNQDINPVFLVIMKEMVNTNISAGQQICNEFNLDGANNSDQVLIHSWLCEKLSLGVISPQYLIPEPAYIPSKSLRFFHVNDSWLDCLLDGALAVDNHLDQNNDVFRRELKEIFNIYLRRFVPSYGYKPQIPSYGFIMLFKVNVMLDLRLQLPGRYLIVEVSFVAGPN